jgi:flagellar hook-associated protein 3 FlgL
MRITQNILQRTALGSMQQNMRQIAVAQQRVMTGLRVQKASDDPGAAAGSMQAGGSLRALEQYRRNIQSAESRTDAEEHALARTTDVLMRVKELAVSQGGDTASAASRATARAEVAQLIEELVSVGNTQFAGSYIFGGNRSDTPPISWVEDEGVRRPVVNPAIDGDFVHETEVGAGQLFKVNHNAQTVFGDEATSPLAALRRLADGLASDDGETIRASIAGIDASFNHTQNLLGDVGARGNHLRMSAVNLDALETNLRIFKSDLVEVDLEKAVTELIGRQTAYQAAMLATSRVMGMTLMDYLR